MATMQNNIEAGPSSGKSLEAENQPGMRLLLIIYILALSFTSAFLSFTFIAVPLVVAMVASCALFGKGLVTGKISAGLFRVEDLALVAFIFVGILSLLLGGEGLLTKNIQYTGRYVGVIGFYLFVIAILASRASRDTLLKWLVISVAVASAFGVVEFILKNIWQFPIDRYIYRPLVAESWTIYSGGLVRARSFAEEPGFFALFLTTLAPVALFWLLGRARKRYFVLLLVLTTTALVITFSAAGVGAAIGAVSVGCFVYLAKSRVKARAMDRLILSLAFFLPVVWLTLVWSVDFLAPIIDKITLQSPVVQGDRVDRWTFGAELFAQAPLLGHGFGSVYFLNVEYGTGLINWYIEILVETGRAGFMFIGIFLGATLIRAYRLESSSAPFYMAALVAALVHYAAISNFWYPWLWFLVVLIRHEERLEKRTAMATARVTDDVQGRQTVLSSSPENT